MKQQHRLKHHHCTGWVPPRPDRKPKLSVTHHAEIKDAAILPRTDLSAKMPAIWDQGPIGACTAFGALRLFLAQVLRIGLGEFLPSFMAHYYWTRLREGTQDSDAGASVADSIQTLKLMGVAPDRLWPYDTGTGRFAVPPPASVAKAALQDVSTDDYGVDNTDPSQVQAALSAGFAVAFGASVFEEIENLTEDQPVLPMPRANEESVGGHCMAVTGHDNEKKLYQVDNSWGTGWGKQGRFYLPYDYFHSADLVSDCHVVDQATVGQDG